MESIAERIKLYRKKTPLTLAATAKALGIPTSTYSRYEKKGNFSPEMLKKLSALFDVSTDILLYGPKEEKEKPFVSPLPEEPKVLKSPNTPFLTNNTDFLSTITNDEINKLKIIRHLSAEDTAFLERFLEEHQKKKS